MKTDKINKKLITELLNNCRISNIDLGKKINLSREGAANRIKKLEEEKIITGYGLELDHCALGFQPYEISIKLQNLKENDEEKISKLLRENKKTIFVEKALGKYDFIIMILTKSLEELDKEIDSIRSNIGINLKVLEISTWIANYDTKSSIFTDKPFQVISKNKENKTFIPDNIEKEIIINLSQNSKESALNLAKKIKVSAVTIANKIKSLTSKQIIKQFRAEINFEKLDIHRYSLYLNISGANIENKIAEYCKNEKQIADLTKFIGKYNYSVEIFAKDNKEFKETVNKLLKTFSKSIIDYDTLILLEEIKHIAKSE